MIYEIFIKIINFTVILNCISVNVFFCDTGLKKFRSYRVKSRNFRSCNPQERGKQNDFSQNEKYRSHASFVTSNTCVTSRCLLECSFITATGGYLPERKRKRLFTFVQDIS
jgi:hypothetical protein